MERLRSVPVADDEVEVLIVGGGAVGLTARALLERWGVRTLLVERHREPSPFPRARLLNVRSMEIYRLLGLAPEITATAFTPEYGRIRFRDTMRDRDFATAAMIGINAPVPESPVTGVVTSQDRLEPILLAGASSPVRFGAGLVDLTEEADGVAALIGGSHGGSLGGSHGASRGSRPGDRTRLRARYVLAADGANSTVRSLLGIGVSGPGRMGGFTTVVFDADLRRWCAHRPAGVYFTAHGLFVPLYPEGGWAWIVPTPDDGPHADWPGLLSRALGGGVRADVVRIQHWEMNAFVADRFRHGRILLTGDAAHAMPIVGGLGLNTGIADVHNVCWKLAGVLRGWASPSLLETYEAERRPVAFRTLRQAVTNTALMLDAQNRRHQQLHPDQPPQTSVERPWSAVSGDVEFSGAEASGHVELPWSERYFAQLGLVLGVTYRSAAVLAGEGPPPEPPGADYVPGAEPGRRMPHLWLGTGRSTLDTFGEWFTVLTPDPAAWSPRTPWPLHIEPLPDEHAAFCGLTSRGALLVRPDGHIAARWPDLPPTGATLLNTLTALTGGGTEAVRRT
ncbi:FAD-dependent monooxygenase [Nonomuraea sp. NPDC047529]|uniref:FAD-dependent monooxygenase n=1 Tax=Nonomuraea sp. NPDC047529 TaxID=3155623 RepID=UPI0033E18D23